MGSQCQACRIRKTRCNARRPSCSLCLELEIECIYQRPSPSTEGHRYGDLDRVHQRLDRIESAIQDLAHSPSNRFRHGLPFDVIQYAVQQPTPPPRSAMSLGRTACKMPNLQRFAPVNDRLSEFAYDVSPTFYQDQRNTVVHFTKATQQVLPNLHLDVSRPRLWELQRSFADNVFKWLPIFSLETATGYLAAGEASNYSEHLPSTCICFLIFAVGAVAADQSAYIESPLSLPGFAYYSRAVTMLQTFVSPDDGLTLLQGKILTG